MRCVFKTEEWKRGRRKALRKGEERVNGSHRKMRLRLIGCDAGVERDRRMIERVLCGRVSGREMGESRNEEMYN